MFMLILGFKRLTFARAMLTNKHLWVCQVGCCQIYTESQVNYSDYIDKHYILVMWACWISATKKMSVPWFAHALRSYFLCAIVGFTLICDKGERGRKWASELDEVLLYVWQDICIITPAYIQVQHLLLLVIQCTHQSMPIMMTLSLNVRVSVPTVGGIKVAIRECSQSNIPTVMVPSLNWQTQTLDKSCTSPLTIMCGLLVMLHNYCSYSPLESPWLPSHCTTIVTVSKDFQDWPSMLYQMTLISGMYQV